MTFKQVCKFIWPFLWIGLGGWAGWAAADGAWAGLIFWFMLSVLLFFWQFIAVMKGQGD